MTATRAEGRPGTGAAGPGATHHYDIHGLLTLRSAVRLRELDQFAVATAPRDPDIEVLVGRVAGPPRLRAGVDRTPRGVVFREHLGALGAGVALDMGTPVVITASPLLARSPHVLYTNVVEGVIRYSLVSRDHLLIHTATVVLDGRGVMMTARTDTGKTGTVLRLARERGAGFLSDDMTILDRQGLARSFPKPMTISAHTLRAVERAPMDRAQRARLAVQSRVHSKGGRTLGQRLAAMNVPIVTINAVAQMVVPPPKHEVQSLVDCPIVASVPVEEIFVLARGPRLTETLEPAEVVDVLLENTEDAYQFPPNGHLVPTLEIGGAGIEDLRRHERQLLADAVAGLPALRLTRDDFTWADDIPELSGGGGTEGGPRPAQGGC